MEARGAKGDRRWGDRANRKGRCQESEKRRKPKQHVWSWIHGRRTAKGHTRGPGEEQVWKDEKGKAAGSEP